MIAERQLARDLIELQANRLAEEGYTVIREPEPASLPAELRSLRPDAIAIGAKPYLLLEVVREGGKSADRIAEIHKAIAGTEWALQLILDSSPQSAQLPSADLDEIESLVASMRRVSEIDPRAGLLLGWSALEAFARQLDNSRFAKPQSPARVVEQLAAMGLALPQQANELRDLAALRNHFIHGGLGVQITRSQTERFAEILTDLIAEGPAEAA